jgi:hypothetical protein
MKNGDLRGTCRERSRVLGQNFIGADPQSAAQAQNIVGRQVDVDVPAALSETGQVFMTGKGESAVTIQNGFFRLSGFGCFHHGFLLIVYRPGWPSHSESLGSIR